MKIIDENEIVRIAEGEIRRFIRDWKRNPYLWESEMDVHAELYMRIKSRLFQANVLPEEYQYQKDKMPTKEYFNSIYCKPLTHIEKANYPDLVIYKHTQELNKKRYKKNEPMLWVCEIKYATEWSSELTGKKIQKRDVNKLKVLLVKKVADHASLLVLYRWMQKYASKQKCEENKIKRERKWRGIRRLEDFSRNKSIKFYFGNKFKFAY